MLTTTVRAHYRAAAAHDAAASAHILASLADGKDRSEDRADFDASQNATYRAATASLQMEKDDVDCAEATRYANLAEQEASNAQESSERGLGEEAEHNHRAAAAHQRAATAHRAAAERDA